MEIPEDLLRLAFKQGWGDAFILRILDEATHRKLTLAETCRLAEVIATNLNLDKLRGGQTSLFLEAARKLGLTSAAELTGLLEESIPCSVAMGARPAQLGKGIVVMVTLTEVIFDQQGQPTNGLYVFDKTNGGKHAQVGDHVTTDVRGRCVEVLRPIPLH